jgi:hypothetical protein
MRVVTHTQLVTRNVTIARYAGLGGLILLVGAFLLNLYALSQPQNVQLVTYVFAAFLVGFALTTVGTAFQNRWGRRPDVGLADALKGLDDRYCLYNYRMGASHVLIGPNGATVLLPKYQAGLITYQDGKWRHPGAPRSFLALLTPRDPLGNPAAEAAHEIDSLNALLKKRAPEIRLAPQAFIVFMHSGAEISAKDSPIPAVHSKQLKDHIRRQPKNAALSPALLADLDAKLGLAPSEAP